MSPDHRRRRRRSPLPPLLSLDASLPPQLVHLDAAAYQAWLRRTSRGTARFFASGWLEAVTKVKW